MTFELTPSQREALDAVKKWFEAPVEPFWIGGLAGSGKSSILPILVEELGLKSEEMQITAPSNKAVGVLRSKGFEDATTVAKVARKAHIAGTDAQKFRSLQHKARECASDPSRYTELKKVLAEIADLRLTGNVYWVYGENLNSRRMKLIVVDEASMLSNWDARQLIATGSPILLIGDYGQLLSVNPTKDSQFDSYVADREPDAILREVMRQKGNGHIIKAAMKVRNDPKETFSNLPPMQWRENNGQAIMRVPSGVIKPEFVETHGIKQFLAHSNNQCFRHIALVREGKPPTPVAGDRLLSYTTAGNIVKSQTYTVVECEDLKNDLLRLTLIDETGVVEGEIQSLTPKKNFNKTLSNKQRLTLLGNSNGKRSSPGLGEIDIADFYFADCITIHKSQGSEWESVGVYLPVSSKWAKIADEDLKRLKYTAITRAKERLVIVV